MITGKSKQKNPTQGRTQQLAEYRCSCQLFLEARITWTQHAPAQVDSGFTFHCVSTV